MRLNRAVALPLLLALTLAGGAQAPMSPSTPFVPDDYLSGSRRLAGDTITFCASSASSLQPLDQAVAEAVGATQLLEVEWRVITYPFPLQPYDFWIGLAPEAIFQALSNECDAFTGYVLSGTNFPDWLTITRPYVTTRYAIVAPEVERLADLPEGARVGTLLGSSGDALFVGFVSSQAEGRFRRIPFANYRSLLEGLVSGDVAAAVLWEPVLAMAEADGTVLPEVTVLTDGPTLPEVSFGMVVLAENTFLRGVLDAAIDALEASGELDALRADHGF